MSREWKSGDVAVVESDFTPPTRRIYGVGPSDDGYWYEGHGGFVRAENVTKVRPLVVIDPEDAEQVKRLDDLLERFTIGDEIPKYEGTVGSTRAALREFANPTPPKPEEPTGLGAVVEDDKGERWIRTSPIGEEHYYKPWQNGPVHRRWETVDVIRVLSEGVQS